MLYLSWGLDTFPKAEEENKHHHNQTQAQVPARQAQVMNTPALMEMENTASTAAQPTHTHTQETVVRCM